MTNYEHIFFPGRMQPPHLGHINVITKALEEAWKVTILIYEVKELDSNNPFQGEEIKFMIQNSLSEQELEKCEIVIMPYFEDSKDRYDFVENNTKLDIDSVILTDSQGLIEKYESEGYLILNPHEFINDKDKSKIRGTVFRELIQADNDEWKKYAAKGTILLNQEIPLKDIIQKYNNL